MGARSRRVNQMKQYWKISIDNFAGFSGYRLYDQRVSFDPEEDTQDCINKLEIILARLEVANYLMRLIAWGRTLGRTS